MTTEPMSLTSGFEDMYRREISQSGAVATALTGDLGDGEDVVQDTMVKAFVRWDAVGRLERPGAWVTGRRCMRVGCVGDGGGPRHGSGGVHDARRA